MRTLVPGLLLSVILLAPGCITDPVTGRTVVGMPISQQEEVQMGLEYGASFKAQYEGAYPDADLQAYCERIVMKMARESHRPDLPWNFTILNSSEVNAFALPGGTVCITRGLLYQLESEAAFAGVMGHEIGHVTHKHAAQGMGRQAILGTVLTGLSAYAESSGSEWAGLGVSLGAVGGQLLLLKYSRGQEAESDDRGVEYALESGYDPREMASVFELFKKLKGENAPPVWMSSHPLDDDRIESVKKESRARMKEVGNKGGAGLIESTSGWNSRIARLRQAQAVYDVYDEANKAFAQAAKEKNRRGMEQVLSRLDECERRLPGHALFSSGKGVVLYELDRKREAQGQFQRAARMQTDLFEPQLYLAQLAFEQEDASAVHRHAMQARKLFPHHPLPFYLDARTFDATGDARSAVPLYQGVLERAPQDSEPYKYSAQRLSALQGTR